MIVKISSKTKWLVEDGKRPQVVDMETKTMSDNHVFQEQKINRTIISEQRKDIVTHLEKLKNKSMIR